MRKSRDLKTGLNGLRRKKRKMEQPTTLCSHHGEEFCMFCMDCAGLKWEKCSLMFVELICFTCVAKPHSEHRYEALDVAQEKIQRVRVYITLFSH